jgi:hypothetical protein
VTACGLVGDGFAEVDVVEDVVEDGFAEVDVVEDVTEGVAEVVDFVEEDIIDVVTDGEVEVVPPVLIEVEVADFVAELVLVVVMAKLLSL